MTNIGVVVALLVIFIVLWDGFETVVLPRRVTRRVQLARLFQQITWAPWSTLAWRQRSGHSREDWLSFYGPLSLLLILVFWASGLILGFALLQWSLGSQLVTQEGVADFTTDLYMSGTTFFTLGLGDVAPRSPTARIMTVVEAGTGFAFLALVITYLPVLYQAFSRREVAISMLDEWAGSPPSALGLLQRASQRGDRLELVLFLKEWERWSAELMEAQLSYPILAYYRSQHENQSWLAALTMILDACTLIIVGVKGVPASQAELTFAIARHSAADLSQVLNVPPREPQVDRLSSVDLMRLREALTRANLSLNEGGPADEKLVQLRRLYEPYVSALADHLLMPLPQWTPSAEAKDNWQRTAWQLSD